MAGLMLGPAFWDGVVQDGECWIWTRGTGRYGTYRRKLAHRVAYEEMVGPIPEGLDLDHLVCQRKRCVRFDHLDPVPRAVNTQRARALVTHCRSNHPYTPENTYITSAGWRQCRTCHRINARKQRERTPA